MTIQDLPLINACLNGLATMFLVLGFVFIKKGNKTAHRNSMISAFVTSAVFLACYLIYHFNTGSTKFVEPAWFKPIYFTILITHIILAVVILPLIFKGNGLPDHQFTFRFCLFWGDRFRTVFLFLIFCFFLENDVKMMPKKMI